MIKKLNLKVFGVVENMTGGIFGKGAAFVWAVVLDLPVLSDFSLLSVYSDSFVPVVHTNDTSEKEFERLMKNLDSITSQL